MSKVAYLYQKFDSTITFPNSTIRDRFAQIMMAELAKADDDEQLKAIEILLFNSTPLTDINLAKKLIERWVALSAAKLVKELKEIDEKQYHHFIKITRLITRIIKETPNLYHRDMCEGLAVAIEAQSKVCAFIKQQFERTCFFIRKRRTNLLRRICYIMFLKDWLKKDLTLETVKFLSYELTRESLDTFHCCFGKKRIFR